jgi:Flp pilus assembly protein TadD
MTPADPSSAPRPSWLEQGSYLTQPRGATLVVAATALATYIATLGYDFAFDDHIVISPTWRVGAGTLLEVVQAPVRAGEVLLRYFRPLTALSYWIDGLLWQGNPGGFHLTNTLWHALVSVLVLHLARRIFPAGPAPLLAGLLFAVHPVHVEAVAWVQGRVDLLCAAGVLAAVLLGIAGMDAEGRRRYRCWAASAMAYGLALLAKETAAVAPLLSAVVLIGRPGATRRQLQQALPLVGMQGLGLLLYLALRTTALGSPTLGILGGTPLAERGLLALKVVPFYLRLLFLPVGLNPKHELAPPSGLLDADVLLGAALLVALVAVGVWGARRGPQNGLAAGLAWLALAGLPTSGVLPISGFVVAERYLYLPSVGFCIAVGGAVTAASACWQPYRRALAAVGAVVLIALGAAAAVQAAMWQDMRAFYEALVLRNPSSAFARNNLGSVYLGIGEYAWAEKEFTEALRVHPRHPGALNNLGLLAQRRGDLAGARHWYQESLRAKPGQGDAWNNLGTLYEEEGDVQRAATAYGQAIRLDPDTPRYLANLAGVLALQGRRDEAASLFERAINLDPTVARWHASLASVRAGERPQEAPMPDARRP